MLVTFRVGVAILDPHCTKKTQCSSLVNCQLMSTGTNTWWKAVWWCFWRCWWSSMTLLETRVWDMSLSLQMCALVHFSKAFTFPWQANQWERKKSPLKLFCQIGNLSVSETKATSLHHRQNSRSQGQNLKLPAKYSGQPGLRTLWEDQNKDDGPWNLIKPETFYTDSFT